MVDDNVNNMNDVKGNQTSNRQTNLYSKNQKLCSKAEQSDNLTEFVIYITYKHMPHTDILPRIITMSE
jgi:hypothetical protein